MATSSQKRPLVAYFCSSIGGCEGALARQAAQRGMRFARSLGAQPLDLCVVKSASDPAAALAQAVVVGASRRTKRMAAAAAAATAQAAATAADTASATAEVRRRRTPHTVAPFLRMRVPRA